MTKKISKTIRLLAATALFAALFSLNIGAMPLGTHGHETASSQQIETGWVAQAHADVTPPPPPPIQVQVQPDPDLMLKTVAQASTYVNKIFSPLIHFITFKIGPFLGNDYIFDGNMGTMLHNIWIINRNIVNIIFVLVLLYLALKHIVKGEDSDIAKSLPLFAIMLVAINFSWLAGRIMLDAANVATNVVFAIPAGISGVAGDTFDQELKKNPCDVNRPKEQEIKGYCTPLAEGTFLTMDAEKTYNYFAPTCTDKSWIDGKTKDYSNAYTTDGSKLADPNHVNKTNSICWQQMKLSDYQQNNASYYLSYSMAKVQNLVRATSPDPINTAVGTLFSLALQIAYLAAFVSLFIVLIMRAAMMWILLAFSPYIVLLYYFEQAGIKASLGQEAGEILSISSFAKWAFAPAKVGAVWTVGFIMITAGQTMDGSTFEKIGTHIYGAGTLFMGMDTVQQFIWYLMTLAVIWFGTFAMFSDLKFASAITNKIKGTVENLGSTGAKTIGAKLPIFPVFDKEGKVRGGTISEAKKSFIGDTGGGGEGRGGDGSETGKKLGAAKAGQIANIAKAAGSGDSAAVISELKNININIEELKKLDEEKIKQEIGKVFGDKKERDDVVKIIVNLKAEDVAKAKKEEDAKIELDKNAAEKAKQAEGKQ